MNSAPKNSPATHSPATASSSSRAENAGISAIEAEQNYVDGLFDRLDDEVAAANARLNEVQAEVDPATPDADALVRRETEYHGLQAKLDRLNVAQMGLVFGRIDIDAPGDNPTEEGLDRRYIGRMGLDAREENYRTLLLDWRAPMARPFYLATTAQPEGVHTRRQIRMSGRTVTDVNDEALNGPGVREEETGVASESALYFAMQRARTGHMTSIVETIQREQDEIIHLLENGAHKQRKSSGYHDQNRHQQEHGEIVRNLAIHGSCFFHFPDTVEGDFNITDQIDNRP